MIFEKVVNIYSKDYVLKRFQTNETAIQVTQGKISALISESEMIELQNSKATMYSKLASAALDINSLQLNFSDLNSKYDTVTGKYSSLDAKVAEYKSGLDGFSANLTQLSTKLNNDYSTTTAMNAAISASVEGLSSTISQTYATGSDVQAKLQAADTTAKGYADAAQKEAIKSANANTDELLKSYATVTAMNSAIDQKADSITASVSSTYATKESLDSTDGKVSSLETWKKSAEVKITDSAIVSTVTSSTSWGKKADKASLISQINQSSESISISASKINLNGIVTANNYFKILTNGSFEANYGKIAGWTVYSTYIQSQLSGVNSTKLYANGTLAFGDCQLSTSGGAFTVKNGLHLYTSVNTSPGGFDDGTERFKIYGLGHVTSGGHLVFGSDGATVSYLSSSSKRYKNHIRNMEDSDIENLYKLPTVFFVYKPGYLEKDSDIPIPGLYAEDVEKYLPLAARYQNGKIEDWNERAVIPYLIKAIQMQHEEIEELKRKVG